MVELTASAAAAGATAQDDVYSLAARIATQGATVRTLKKEQAASEQIQAEVKKLTDLKAYLALLEAEVAPTETFNRDAFDQLILRKMYVVPAFEIHNGPAGLFDYGPPSCTLKANIIGMWRSHFVVEENMLEMECTSLTPSQVLEASGHVERFTDFMVRDEKTGECFRADVLLENVIDDLFAKNPYMPKEEREAHEVIQRQADAFSVDELDAMLKKYNVMSPANPENGITTPFPFNLMFKTMIGPDGKQVGFLRPETAQGLFVNFKRLLEYNSGKMPFAAAQIGTGFRNEIAPAKGLLRVREFCMGEIEHFVNPNDKSCPKFGAVKDKVLTLFSADDQLKTGRTVDKAIGEAVSEGLVGNETLGYFMARTQQWLENIGVDPARMRFRQHLRTEMAHYAADCWDMEIKMSYGWIECVGHADRACFDLEQHAAATKTPMVASELLKTPMEVESYIAEPNKKKIGPKFKMDQKKIILALEALDNDGAQALEAALNSAGKAEIAGGFEITPDLVSFKKEKKTVQEVKFTPHVIEPSFGMGRILYAVLEHSFYQREGSEERTVMSFPPRVAPIKVAIFRLTNNAALDTVAVDVNKRISSAGLVTRVDSSSATVGRRYARADELGIPFGVTVDFESLLDSSVTIRERDSMAQVRVPMTHVASLLQALCTETKTWAEVVARYPLVSAAGEGDDEGEEDAVAAKAKAEKKAAAAEPKALTIDNCRRAMFSRPTVPIIK